MWHEFNGHFANQQRETGKNLNHHDFLEADYINKNASLNRKSFF
jgi:hypothetical protein